jgi:molybdopterin-guanine dinucleotide biosynthesis protein A
VQNTAILAGGRTTRFGGRHASPLTVDGRSIFDHQVADVSLLTPDLLANVNTPADHAGLEALRSHEL